MQTRQTFLLFFYLYCIIASGQNRVMGTVVDSTTSEPLAFANVVFNNNSAMHVLSDVNGQFTFESKNLLSSVTVTYTGYEKTVLKINSQNALIIAKMRASNDVLNEVVIRSDENPANIVMAKVIANKNYNNPENLKSFSYESYNKVVYDFIARKNSHDSLIFNSVFKNDHLFLMESATKRKFLNPALSTEVVTGTKISGFKNPTFASVATDLQPFSFYQDYIKLLNVRYLNPIANSSLKKYRFRLEEQLYQGGDTVFVISYKPKSSKNFDGLKGLLYVNSNKYAIQNAIASPYEKGKIDIRIQQQYRLEKGGYWFPEQLNYLLTLNDYPTPGAGVFAEGKSYISNVEIDIPLTKKDFSVQGIQIDDQATTRDSVFWNSVRSQRLNPAEKQTYTILDSIGTAQHFDYYLTWIEKVSQGRIPFRYLDIDLTKTFNYNRFEGLRAGTGFITNDDFLKKISLGGFFGYGLKDHKWKYGLEAKFLLSKKSDGISIKHQDNLVEIGNYGLKSYAEQLYRFRNLLGFRYDRIVENSINVFVNSLRFTHISASITHANTDPQYLYNVVLEKNSFSNYKNTAASLYIRYAYREKAAGLGQSLNSESTYPVLYVCFSKGIKNAGADFNYQKIELAAEQSFYTRDFGLTSYRIELGNVDRTIPAGLLFTGAGSYDTNFPFSIKNTFQTMRPYEFLSDRYANLFLSHDFGALLFKTPKLAPNVVVLTNIGWGNLSHPSAHVYPDFETMENVYLESGVKLNNILKQNYLNLGYLGIGSGVFYRYGNYSNKEFRDNIAVKLTLNYTIK